MSLGEYIGAGSGTTKLLLHLNGNSTDSSGNGNNGTDTAITYSQANGKFGQGAGFNGSTSEINTSLIFGGNITQTKNCWFKLTNTSQISFLLYDFDNNTHVSLGLKIDSGNLYWKRIKQGVEIQKTGGIFTDTSSWHLASCIYDGSTLKLYVDGVRLGTDIAASGNGITVAPSSNSMGFLGYNGSLDEIVFENRAWSAEEVKKYYTNAKGFYSTL